MAWEWVAPTVTGVVALAGIGATLRTAAQGRRHAEHLATENHGRAREEMLRQERIGLYADALAHAVDLERRLDAVWVSGGGGDAFDISIRPRDAPLILASMDDISVRMRLLADEEAEEAWAALNAAWEARQWWAENEFSGDPDEDAPSHLTGLHCAPQLTTSRSSVGDRSSEWRRLSQESVYGYGAASRARDLPRPALRSIRSWIAAMPSQEDLG